MTLPDNRTPMQSDDMAKLHPSTWEAQCEQLQSKLAEAESRASWAEMTKNRATEETKALRARVATLEAALSAVDLCDATGGDHRIERQGQYRFCKECGETMTEKRIIAAKRATIARAALEAKP